MISNVRYVIKVLQEIPVVLSLLVVMNFITDAVNCDFSWYISPLFGFSLYVLIRLYSASKRVYVSKWSKILYLELIIVSITDFFDTFLHFKTNFVTLYQTFSTIAIVAIVASLITFIYDKYRYKI